MIYKEIFRVIIHGNNWEFYIKKGDYLKLITLPVEEVEDYSKLRLEYLKKYHHPAPQMSDSEWIDTLARLCENKRGELYAL